MTKELRYHVWSILPKEFKEEMLTVSRKEVCSIYDHAIGLITKTIISEV